MPGRRKHLIVTANSAWNIYNYRMPLILALQNSGFQVSIIAPPDHTVEKLEGAGCRFIPLKMDPKSTTLATELLLICRVFRLLWREKPNHILSFTIKNNIYFGLCCRLLRIQYAPNVSGLGSVFSAPGHLQRLVTVLYRIAFRRASTIFFQNPDDQSLFAKLGINSATKTECLPGSGIDLQQFKFQELPPNRDEITFLLIGRLLWEKGVGQYVAAADALKKKYPNVTFQLLGYCDVANPSAISKTQVQEWVASGVIEYLGTTDDVRPLIEAADCIVLPSAYGEGTPRTLLESCAVGRAIIATNIPGCREVVDHGQNGYLCEKKSVPSLTEALENFISLPHIARMEMGRKGREKVEREFNVGQVIEQYSALLIQE